MMQLELSVGKNVNQLNLWGLIGVLDDYLGALGVKFFLS